jgi:hypothetical protein
MSSTFSHVAREVAQRYATLQAIKAALDHVGARAEQPIAEMDVERKLMLVGHFVRALRSVSVVDASHLERDLFHALDAAPTARRAVEVKDAISLITVRNHVGQVASALGMPWAEGMQVQSALSDVARFLAQHGGGRIETVARPDGGIRFDVWTNRALAPFSIEYPSQKPPWLVGVAALAQGFHAHHVHGGTHIEFSIPPRTSAAAA